MGLLRRLTRDRGRAARSRAAADLYAAAVGQARLSGFYTTLGVPDTLDGRFELIVLHVHLLCRRLGRLGAAGAAMAQSVFDALFRDMDRNLRELGVGDPSMPRRIKAMIEAYYGRAQAYDAALAAGGDALARALARNVYNADAPAGADRLADYVRRCAAALEAQDDLSGGAVTFPPLVFPSPAKSGGG